MDILKYQKKAAIDAVESTNPVKIFFGTVSSINPLQINVEQKLPLGEKQLILGSLVRDFDVDFTISSQTEPETAHKHAISVQDSYTGGGSATSSPTSHSHAYSGRKTITLHLGLKVGDSVVLIRMQGGQKYLVLDRVR